MRSTAARSGELWWAPPRPQRARARVQGAHTHYLRGLSAPRARGVRRARGPGCRAWQEHGGGSACVWERDADAAREWLGRDRRSTCERRRRSVLAIRACLRSRDGRAVLSICFHSALARGISISAAQARACAKRGKLRVRSRGYDTRTHVCILHGVDPCSLESAKYTATVCRALAGYRVQSSGLGIRKH